MKEVVGGIVGDAADNVEEVVGDVDDVVGVQRVKVVVIGPLDAIVDPDVACGVVVECTASKKDKKKLANEARNQVFQVNYSTANFWSFFKAINFKSNFT